MRFVLAFLLALTAIGEILRVNDDVGSHAPVVTKELVDNRAIIVEEDSKKHGKKHHAAAHRETREKVEIPVVLPLKYALPITAPVLTGYLIFLIWLAIFCSGFCCLFQVQTPGSFVDKSLVLHKEF